MAHTEFFHRAASRRRTAFGRTLRLANLIDLWRSRQALKRLDQAALKDIGLSATDAKHEADRPVWDVPANWRI